MTRGVRAWNVLHVCVRGHHRAGGGGARNLSLKQTSPSLHAKNSDATARGGKMRERLAGSHPGLPREGGVEEGMPPDCRGGCPRAHDVLRRIASHHA